MKKRIWLRKDSGYDFLCGNKSFAGTRERARWEDDKEYTRPARSPRNLPDSFDDTKRIKKYKSWKHRSKARHQSECDEYFEQDYYPIQPKCKFKYENNNNE